METDISTLQRYQERMHRVVQYIDTHLDQVLSVETLAAQAHFSAFHFHRLFAALMGERIGDYVRRRRLEVAALRLLANPSLSILEIALSVGFSSAEAYSRAFKERFAMSPSQWRQQNKRSRSEQQFENSKNNQILSKQSQVTAAWPLQNSLIKNLNRNVMMQVILLKRPAARIAYLRYVGEYGAPLGEFWRNQVQTWLQQEGLADYARYGISHDDPSICDPLKCRYDAAVEVPADYQAKGSALIAEIPAGLYAALDFYGKSHEIGEVWDSLLRDWLPGSGYQLDARPCFEYYPAMARFNPETGEFACQIMLPVSRL